MIVPPHGRLSMRVATSFEMRKAPNAPSSQPRLNFHAGVSSSGRWPICAPTLYTQHIIGPTSASTRSTSNWTSSSFVQSMPQNATARPPLSSISLTSASSFSALLRRTTAAIKPFSLITLATCAPTPEPAPMTRQTFLESDDEAVAEDDADSNRRLLRWRWTCN